MTKRVPKSGTNPDGVDFGEFLRQLRKDKSVTGAELAKRVGTSQATVSKIETGIQPPSVEYLARLANALHLRATTLKHLLKMFNRLPSARATEVLIPFDLFDFLQTDDTERRQKETQALEQAATVVRVYQPLVIPGILQTDEYARSVLYLSGVTNEEAAERGLAARRRRRQALDRAEKRFRFIIGEAALRNRVCSNTTMIDQIEHLKAVNGKTTVSLSVLPWSTRLRTLILSSLYIFDESSLYIELTHGELRQTRAADVHFYVQRFNDAEKIALTGFEAEQVLSRIARDYQRLEELEQSAGATVF